MLISLDVAFRNIGWSVFDKGKVIAVGVITTKKSTEKNIRVSDDYFNGASKLYKGLIDITTFHAVDGVLAELPFGGSQNSKAGTQMGIATGVIASFCTNWELPFEGATPQEVKLAATGNKEATKEEVMDAICKKFGWEKVIKQGPKRAMVNFKVLGQLYGKGQFEHIADSVGAYLALKQNNLVKIYG